MPNGTLHLKLNTFVGAPVLFLSSLLLAPTNETATAFAVGYLWGTFFASPDLDVNGMDASEENFGKLAHFFGHGAEHVVARLYHWLWYPYSLAMPHRGKGHYPLIGTGLRMLYFIGLWLALLLVARHLFGIQWFPDIPQFLNKDWDIVLSLYIGWEAASLVHIVADHIVHGDGGHHEKFYWSKR